MVYQMVSKGKTQNGNSVFLPDSMGSSEAHPCCLPDAFDNYLIGLQYKETLFELPFGLQKVTDYTALG